MTHRFWRACGFALLLLFVQQTALTHALEHVAADVLHLDADSDGEACHECLALGGLQSGGAIPGLIWAGSALAAAEIESALVAAPSRRAATAHTIRAPPENRD